MSVSKPHSEREELQATISDLANRAPQMTANDFAVAALQPLMAANNMISDLEEQLQAALDREAGTSDALQEEIARATENGRLAKRLHEQFEALLAEAKRHEWFWDQTDDKWRCPECLNWDKNGHGVDCSWGEALASNPASEPETP